MTQIAHARARRTPGPKDSRDIHRFAVSLSIQQGIMGVLRYNPVLDVGCRDPYVGLYGRLRKFGWHGQYIGIDDRIPRSAVVAYADDIILRSCSLEGRLPFPPSPRHPLKEIAAAYCLQTMRRVQNQEALMLEMRRVACQVLVVGGVTEKQLRTWDCQKIGYVDLGGLPQVYGLWFNRWAEDVRRRMERWPVAADGFFMGTPRPKRLYCCRKCGEIDYTGAQKFPCGHCGHENR